MRTTDDQIAKAAAHLRAYARTLAGDQDKAAERKDVLDAAEAMDALWVARRLQSTAVIAA